jgi:hypothetical protein
MNFIPKTEEEIQKSNLLPEGVYGFEVVEAKQKTSQKGNAMIALKLLVYPHDPDAKPRTVFDYLMEKMAFKLRHFCVFNGLLEKYNSGTLNPDDCINKKGWCQIGVRQDEKREYPPQNTVMDYVESSSKAVLAGIDLEEDDIPF